MNDYLPILAIETSSRLCSVSVYFSDDLYSEFSVNKKNIHSEILFDLIKECISELNINVDSLKSIAVSIGPGSFTGLRVGLSAAKGIAFGKGIPIIPVPTFEALALQISEFSKPSTNFSICNSVNRDEYYLSEFHSKINGYEVTRELELIKKTDFKNKIKTDLVFGDFQNKSSISSIPSSLFIAKWAYLFGNDLLTFDHDYLEPNYIKNFVARRTK